jgi:hypothetical protein
MWPLGDSLPEIFETVLDEATSENDPLAYVREELKQDLEDYHDMFLRVRKSWEWMMEQRRAWRKHAKNIRGLLQTQATAKLRKREERDMASKVVENRPANELAFYTGQHAAFHSNAEGPIARRKEVGYLGYMVVPNRNHPYYKGREFGKFIMDKDLIDRRTNTFRRPACLPFDVSPVLTDPNPGNNTGHTYWTGIRDALEGLPEPEFTGVELPVYVHSEHDTFPWG